MLFGDLAHLPSAPPDADQFRDKIKAAEDLAKAEGLDVPRGTDDGLAPPMIPGMAPRLATGTKVRDKLSGQTGSVAEAPGGPGMDYGDVVFMKMDSDGATHPVLSEFLEPVPTAAPVVSLAPSPGAGAVLPPPSALPAKPEAKKLELADGAAAPGSPIPEKKSSTNAALHRRMMNARLSTPVRAEKDLNKIAYEQGKIERQRTDSGSRDPHANTVKSARDAYDALYSRSGALPPEHLEHFTRGYDEGAKVTAGPAKVPSAPTQTDADPVITKAGDARALRYSALVAKLKAKTGPTHSDALTIIGYVPQGWDQLVARLMGDGLMLRSPKSAYDVGAMVKAKFTETEIRYILGCKGVPMYALDRVFGQLKAGFKEDQAEIKEKDAETAAELSERRGPITRKPSRETDKVYPVKRDRGMMPPAKLKAGEPSKPMPTEDPGQGMVWAWNQTTQDWYKTDKAG